MLQNNEIGHELKIANNLFKRQIDKKFNIDLNANQHFVLHFIMEAHRKNKDIFQRDIEKELNIRRSTATVMLQTLEKNGYIERESVDYDARLKRIVPIFKFDKKEFKSKVKEIELMATNGITEEELNIFLSVLDKIKNNLKEREDEKTI